MPDIPLTLGIEEEYQIVNHRTRGLTSFVQPLLEESQPILGDQVKKEFMQSQIEVASSICENVQDTRTELIRLRRLIHEMAEQHDRTIVAASTHPFSRWEDQLINPGERYRVLEAETQALGRQMLIFGMHVHLGFGTDPEQFELIIEIQNQLRYFLPHILALTTSSPFWDGRDTGLKSYRSIIFKSLPRSGIPPIFNSFSEFTRLVDDFGRAGSLGAQPKHGAGADYTRLHWDARPQLHFGTLEVRVADICTTVDEAICIVALLQALAAKLIKLREQNQGWLIYKHEYIEENKWRAVRYGLDGKLIDWGKREEVPMRTLAKDMLAFVDDVVDELGSRQEVEYVHTILENGTSADRQLAVYHDALNAGASEKEALNEVVEHLIRETYQGWD